MPPRRTFVLWPTCRPSMAASRVGEWAANAVDLTRTVFVFGCDDAETAARVVELTERLRTAGRLPPLFARHVLVCPDNPGGVAHCATKLTRWALGRAEDEDLVVLASDDFGCPPGWDACLMRALRGGEVAAVKDGYHAEHTELLTIPVLGGAALRRLGGVVYHPAYHHMFSDNEAWLNAQQAGALRNLRATHPALTFKHHHYIVSARPRDEKDDRANAWWKQDEALWHARKGLPLAERLALPAGWSDEVQTATSAS